MPTCNDNHHIVDVHNHYKHLAPSIKAAYLVPYWLCRPLQSLVAILEVNAKLGCGQQALKDNNELGIHTFRQKLSIRLIMNDCVTDNSESIKKNERIKYCHYRHLLKRALKSTKTCCAACEIWICASTDPHQRRICRSENCNNRCRTYCICNPSRWYFKACVQIHIEVEVTDLLSD